MNNVNDGVAWRCCCEQARGCFVAVVVAVVVVVVVVSVSPFSSAYRQ